ncbi:hypothetical protein F383_27780 [Gossypium arboreum]|uniref:Uncharacterized protein n=1 Tax=Gossypium arboreum TaxID=29729 RepID=A0A0B0PAX8_GOSAR|nr:hypothetical protein F383_27780 [Gossypium arboreum]
MEAVSNLLFWVLLWLPCQWHLRAMAGTSHLSKGSSTFF